MTEAAVPVFSLDLLQTLTLAAVVYYGGVLLRRRVGILDRLNIPTPVVGGLLFAAIAFLLRDRVLNIQLNTTAQPVLMVAFFTTIGMGASVALLRAGGIPVLVFLIFSIAVCFIQNLVGMGVATAFGEHPLMGVLAGSVTLMGGPATGLAFAPQFAAAGVEGAEVIAVSAAMVGIICGGLVGSPVGTWLINRFQLAPGPAPRGEREAELEFPRDWHSRMPLETRPGRALVVEVEREDTALIRNLVVLALAMGLGSVVSYFMQQGGLTLPAYIGAMVVASLLRNLDDVSGWLEINENAMEFIGGVALNIFLVVALMDLKLWQLAGQALPLVAILFTQVLVIAALALLVSYPLMGRTYDSAVMAGGFVGFAMGTTANAVANMKALVDRYGPAPRAFLVIPLVGAFFIDFANALVVTGFLNLVP
jgi:ESS family glutamate:Na+ symporter